MLRKNGMRQPQARNSLAGDLAERQHREVGEEQPGGHAELRPRGDEAAIGIALGPFHGQQHRAAPLAADPDALDEAQDGQQDRTPDSDLVVGRNERDREGRDAHQQQGRDQRRLAADAIAVVAEDRGADRPRDEPDRVDAERLQRADQRIGVREVQLGEDQAGDGAVEEEVVPLDGGADGARDDRAPELYAVVGRCCGDCRCCHRFLLRFEALPAGFYVTDVRPA